MSTRNSQLKGKMATKVTPQPDYSYEAGLPDLYQTFGTVSGFTLMCLYNAYRRRPYVLYNPLQIPLYIGAGFGGGTLLKNARDKYLDNKIKVAETYMQQHPEEFVEPPPRIYKDVLKSWVPRR